MDVAETAIPTGIDGKQRHRAEATTQIDPLVPATRQLLIVIAHQDFLSGEYPFPGLGLCADDRIRFDLIEVDGELGIVLVRGRSWKLPVDGRHIGRCAAIEPWWQ